MTAQRRDLREMCTEGTDEAVAARHVDGPLDGGRARAASACRRLAALDDRVRVAAQDRLLRLREDLAALENLLDAREAAVLPLELGKDLQVGSENVQASVHLCRRLSLWSRVASGRRGRLGISSLRYLHNMSRLCGARLEMVTCGATPEPSARDRDGRPSRNAGREKAQVTSARCSSSASDASDQLLR